MAHRPAFLFYSGAFLFVALASTTCTASDMSGSEVDGGSSMTVSCPSGDAQALAAMGDDPPDGTGTAESVITIENVGGSGQYPKVTSMNPGVFGQTCPGDACVKQMTAVSGPLAPFDDEMTVNLRGPLELYDFAYYQPSGGNYSRVSFWNRCGSDRITFLNNKGGNISGVFTACGGNSQSYATADGTTAAPAATPFSGSLANGVEVNLLSTDVCVGQDDASDCGFSRGVALHGFGGQNGAKILVLRVRMPRYTGATGGSYYDEPALWILNARIVRTAQYGCNCRGVGSPGGCGELDVAEVLNSPHRTHATSTIYSFQGAIGADGASGSGHYFARPVNQSAIFVVIFDRAGKTAQTGRVQMLRLPADGFDFGSSIDAATVAGWLARTGFTMALP